ncbi:hypothetical protein SODALDRAFT_335603 [Sodiomyces alkalinus F11]|uniref:Uncharacterized protein n=1 Tax=Sodiomyces alkalinus (strain CBS 110278 / VKM F-3762 / F11) TaxID=1314773 RepID=A0A3N2PPT0_SODAK|nr:hypothetical protein SODALDRAFT_335603 [Sodiomyces alkalinus F11]ROT36508.1 hypothetical protein SODALDRAFT_335603 [Sodiomyces alkalinus F11]
MTTWLPIPSTFPLLGLSHGTETSREPVKGIPEDAVLISIDFEKYEIFNRTSIDAAVCTQMGIAVLDSRLLRGRDDAIWLSSHATTPIQTYLFATGTPEYLRNASGIPFRRNGRS